MHPLVLYEIARLEHAHAVRQAEAQWELRAARVPIGRPRRQLSTRLQRWLRRPALPVAPHGASY